MARKVEVSQEQYTKMKKEILDNLFIDRYDVKLTDIEISNLKSIKIMSPEGPILVSLSKRAIGGLVEALGISQKFVSTLRKSFGEDNQELLNLIIKRIKGQKVKSLTVVYHKTFREITDVYPAGTRLLSDFQYFEILEKVLSRTPGAYLRNLTQTSEGDLKAVLANPGLEFQFSRLADECFTSGMTLDLEGRQLTTSFFTERLICSNGCTTQNKLASRTVVVKDKIPDFLTAILDADYHLDSIDAFKRRLNRCYNTRASLKELLEVDRYVNTILGNYYGPLTDNMSVHRLKLGFGEGILADTMNHKFMKTDITLWKLVNEVTALSARIEQHRVAVPEKTNLSLQVIGGDLMFSIPDLAPNNIKQIYP